MHLVVDVYLVFSEKHIYLLYIYINIYKIYIHYTSFLPVDSYQRLYDVPFCVHVKRVLVQVFKVVLVLRPWAVRGSPHTFPLHDGRSETTSTSIFFKLRGFKVPLVVSLVVLLLVLFVVPFVVLLVVPFVVPFVVQLEVLLVVSSVVLFVVPLVALLILPLVVLFVVLLIVPLVVPLVVLFVVLYAVPTCLSMSANRLLAPSLNSCGLSQSKPSSSFTRTNQSKDS